MVRHEGFVGGLKKWGLASPAPSVDPGPGRGHAVPCGARGVGAGAGVNERKFSASGWVRVRERKPGTLLDARGGLGGYRATGAFLRLRQKWQVEFST